MAYVVASIIWIVGFAVAAIAASSGLYGKVPINIALGATVAAVLVALTHHHIPSW